MLQYRRSGARTVMPYALSTLAAATLFLAAGPVNAATNYTASVSVSSSQTCTLTVSPPTYTAFTAKWTKSSASATTLTPTNSSTPAYIKFSYGTADCGRPDTYITTEAGGGAVVDPDTGVIAARAAAGNGAFWRFAPVLADAKMYANPNYTSQSPYASVDVPGMSETATFTGASVIHSQGTVYGKVWPRGGGTMKGMEMTDDYGLDVDGHALWAVPLIVKGSLAGRTSVSAKKVNFRTPKSASGQLGIGVVLDTNPINSAGQYTPDAVTDGTSVSFGFVVSLSSD